MNNSWMLDFSGCDGGKIGSPSNQSIWVCGIEWGGGHSPEALKEYINQDWNNSPEFGYREIKYYPYNEVVYKILAVINGYALEDYKKFAENEQPFLHDSDSPYFKMNLYPISFPNTQHKHWTSAHTEITGFKDKREYLEWCTTNRFPVMNNWVQKYNPKLIICFGSSYAQDFNLAFSDSNDEYHIEEFEHAKLQWKKNSNGTVIAVLPFPKVQLKHNSAMQQLGIRLKELID